MEQLETMEYYILQTQDILNSIYKNWIIEIKKKFKNYINNFSWFLLHAEKP